MLAVLNLAQATKSEILDDCEGGEWNAHNFFIYAQTLFMGPIYNAATSLEELGCCNEH